MFVIPLDPSPISSHCKYSIIKHQIRETEQARRAQTPLWASFLAKLMLRRHIPVPVNGAPALAALTWSGCTCNQSSPDHPDVTPVLEQSG